MYFLTISARLRWFVTSLFPRPQRRRVGMLWCRMGRAMGGYFRGVAIDAVIIGVLTWVALWSLDIEFALPLAVLAGLGEFVPYLGPVVVALPAVAVGLLQSVQQGALVAAVYVVIQQIESHIVTPNVMRTQTDIRPATVIVALVSGYAVAGVLGAIAAIPVFAAARVLLVHVIAPAIRRSARTVERAERWHGGKSADA
jgi:predicted PurR-regulated permease PerM